jgi:YHS domain-containing protein
MDLSLIVESQSATSLRASYSCPCGCHPQVSYAHGESAAHDTCCCGNEFHVGAGASLPVARPGFKLLTTHVEAPWGEVVPVAWAIGPSTHGDEDEDEHLEQHHGRASAVALDPVCGMTVEPDVASARGLASSHLAHDYFFCGRGCKLDFDEDPERYLDPGYTPTM